MKNAKTKEVVKFKPEKEGIGFEIIPLNEFYTRPDKNRHTAHIINFYAILFITEGNGEHEIDFQRYKYTKNSSLFIQKGQEHKWVKYENTEGFIIVFTETFFEKNQLMFKDASYSLSYNSCFYNPCVSIEPDNLLPFKAFVEYIYAEFLLPNNPQKAEILQCLLRTFILKIRSNTPPDKPVHDFAQKELFLRFQIMIDEKIHQSRNVNDYCKWLSVSYKKLNEASKTFTQNTAKAFLDQVLLLKAKQLLVDNKFSISEISYSLSFDEPTNFAKFFKKHTKVSPKVFQENALFD